MAFLTSEGAGHLIEKLSDSKNIKIAGNKYGNRVNNVVDKLVEKADNVTKAVEQEVINNSAMFKVGTGDVDVSSDVHDGFGEIGLKGVTYQNLLGELEAASTTWQQTNDKYILDLKAGNGQPQIRYRLSYPLKPNTKYTLICEIKEYTTGYPHFCFMTGDNELVASTTEFSPKTVGIHSAVLATTISDITAELLRILPRANIDNTYSIGKNIVILEGDHTNNPNLPSYFEGIVGVGDKSKNLLNEKTMVIGGVNSSTGEFVTDGTRKRSDYIPFEGNNPFVSINSDSLFFYDVNKTYISRIATVNGTSPANAKYVVVRASKDSTNIQLQYGSVATEYQPYGTHKIEILSHGKNLINKNECKIGMFYQGGIRFPSNAHHPCVLVKVKPNTKYRINRNDNAVYIELGNTPNDYITAVNSGTPFVTTSNTNYLRIRPHKGLQQEERVYNSLEEFANSIQLEEGVDNFTNYEPYVEDKTQILLDEPLMRLPNGVCDEITRDGKLIRRVGKIVLDGSENWVGNNGSTTHFSYVGGMKTVNHLGYNKTLICSNIPTNGDTRSKDSIFTVSNRGFCVVLSSSKVDGTVSDLKKWLSNNPTTVYYELKEPVITEIITPSLRIFKDGHITFNTTVAPESTHLVQLNKSAQIERSIREVQGLDCRVDKLESFYDDMILETNHKLNLLNFDFECIKEREDI